MNTEQLIKDLIKQFKAGKLKQADFENALFELINRHTTQVVNNALNEERQLFMKNAYLTIWQTLQKKTKDNFLSDNDKLFELSYGIADKSWQYYLAQRQREYTAYMESLKAQQQSKPVEVAEGTDENTGSDNG